MASSPEDEYESGPLDSPSPPSLSPKDTSVFPSPSPSAPTIESPRPALRSISASAATTMTPSSTPLGTLNAARNIRPQPPPISSANGLKQLNPDIMARVDAMRRSRAGAPPPNMRQQSGISGRPQGPSQAPSGPITGTPLLGTQGGLAPGFRMTPGTKPSIPNYQSAPAVPGMGMGARNKPSLAEKRGLALPGGLPAVGQNSNAAPNTGRKKPGLTLSQMNGENPDAKNNNPPKQETMMDRYSEYLDTKTGSLQFKGKAILNSEGVQFTGGTTFSISLDEVDTLDELGKGNYGTVYKVRHSRPKMRRPGLGLAGNKATPGSPTLKASNDGKNESSPASKPASGTGIIMAMKEIRLELDDAKFAAIIMELDILHRCASPYIIDFYGAFFQEGAVYICIEFMDGGSIDKLYGDGVPENILRKITLATTMGLRSLKDDHNIIHRDVKPTNILINTRGQVKICDFGVSGNLVASIAKTNIGCQSYMAPERISSGGVAQAGANPGGGTYSVQSDIWSLGLTIIECAMGRYPYPPETYDNIFSQLSAIVDGDPPDLPKEGFSEAARDFVAGCLHKIPKRRPTYAMLLQHPWLAPLLKPPTISEEDEDVSLSSGSNSAGGLDGDMSKMSLNGNALAPFDSEVAEWVKEALEKRKKGTLGKGAPKPALHAAPLDAVSSPSQKDTKELEASGGPGSEPKES